MHNLNGTADLTGMARRCLPADPDIAAAMLADVERGVTQLLKGWELLRSIVTDYDGGELPPAEAMTAVRAVIRSIPWSDA